MIVVQGVNSMDFGQDEKGDRTFRVSYKSWTDAPPTSITAVMVTAAVEDATGYRIGSPYCDDTGSLCKKRQSRCQARRDGPPPKWEWLTDLDFSSAISPSNPQGPTSEKDPAKRPPKIGVTIERYEAPALLDINGAKIANSAGDQVIRTKKRSKVIFRWSRVMRFWNWVWLQEAPTGFLYSRNAAIWSPAGPYTTLIGNSTVAAGKARMENLTAEISFEDGGCVQVDAEIHVDDDEFAEIFLDQGFFHLAQAGNPYPPVGAPPAVARRRFVDRNGFANQPQMLDGNGGALPLNADPMKRNFQLYVTKNWNAPPWTGDGGFFSLPT